MRLLPIRPLALRRARPVAGGTARARPLQAGGRRKVVVLSELVVLNLHRTALHASVEGEMTTGVRARDCGTLSSLRSRSANDSLFATLVRRLLGRTPRPASQLFYIRLNAKGKCGGPRGEAAQPRRSRQVVGSSPASRTGRFFGPRRFFATRAGPVAR